MSSQLSEANLRRFFFQCHCRKLISCSPRLFRRNRTQRMQRYAICLVAIMLNAFVPTTTLPQGAPESVCHSLLPFHGGGIPPSYSRPPYRIELSNVAVNQGQVLHIEIRPQVPELKFGGFMIHARSLSPPYQVVGRFAPSVDGLVKLINCGNFDNTATHTSPSPKTGIALQWQAPSDYVGEVVFKWVESIRSIVALNKSPMTIWILAQPLLKNMPSSGLASNRLQWWSCSVACPFSHHSVSHRLVDHFHRPIRTTIRQVTMKS